MRLMLKSITLVPRDPDTPGKRYMARFISPISSVGRGGGVGGVSREMGFLNVFTVFLRYSNYWVRFIPNVTN